ncbi:MAG: hypothetical protein DI534_09760 [Leifsonia xyli]|nr:MAG: hypothetical protein DI534_09760 [Leifsonia xyli]
MSTDNPQLPQIPALPSELATHAPVHSVLDPRELPSQVSDAARRWAMHIAREEVESGATAHLHFWGRVDALHAELEAQHFEHFRAVLEAQERMRIAKSAWQDAAVQDLRESRRRATYTCPVCSTFREDARGQVGNRPLADGRQLTSCKLCHTVASALMLEHLRAEVVKAGTTREQLVRTELFPPAFARKGGE